LGFWDGFDAAFAKLLWLLVSIQKVLAKILQNGRVLFRTHCSVNYCRTNKRKNFFSERVVKVWNSLPPSIVKFDSLARFRNSINKINLRIYTKYLCF